MDENIIHQLRCVVQDLGCVLDQVKPLTKREQFAMAAMQGLCVPCIPGSHNLNSMGEEFHKARMAVRLADALIAELEKP